MAAPAPPAPALPPAVSPDQILDYAPRGSRILRIDANIVAYFGDLFQSFRSTTTAILASRDHKAPTNTASSRNRS
jgi:hypothetical protein